ncbi:MAG: outer membrane beta-barrel protein [Paludibacteraceae bacterium]|nr:outer membrane beta-barrel protein [Paludibacteraceae bacterium]MBQ8704716.1 outer membrane beta-barrel protein [Paludibacteraceae bacterium]
MKENKIHSWLAVALFLCMGLSAYAQGQPYLCEIGLQGGCGYYVGDAAQHIFMHPREAYGVHFRYKFTKRWAIQAKVSGQRITGYDYTMDGRKLDTRWQNQLINVDVMAEFNFFRFGEANRYDKRIKPYTPYIFLGIGAGVYGANGENKPIFNHAMAYIPLGIGFKWKFHDCVGLNIAWQHNIYMADNLESRESLDNKYQMNGWNWMNCDLTGMLTAGIVFEFGRAKAPCRICNW